MDVESGVDLLALEELMATLRDWLVICQPRVPAVWEGVSNEVRDANGRQCCKYREIWRQHAASYDQVGEHEARHPKGQEDGFASVCQKQCKYMSTKRSSATMFTWMYRAVHDLLRIPHLLCHVFDLAGLVLREQVLRLLQSLRAREQGPDQ